ncbi:MAG: XdhC family protein [Hyphomicrobiaceae bacterium]|nr:XdhC family protein [Hyphomicrobiaceae bacterium]
MRLSTLKALNQERAARRAAVLVTELSGVEPERLVRAGESADNPALDAEIALRLRTGKSGRVEIAGQSFFLTVKVPPPRLVVIGAVHISQALAPMALASGFDVTIIDPRTAFATPERFAGLDLRPVWPEDVDLAALLDPYTALAALTHDPKIDDTPLKAALEAGCFYVGALGSRKTHGRRLDRLAASGISDKALARIDAPIGLDIGASNPAEIAVSVLAAIILALRGAKGG